LSTESDFWDAIAKLRSVGASSILVLPIEDDGLELVSNVKYSNGLI